VASTVLSNPSMNEDDDRPQRRPTFENGQDIRDRAFEYACRVVGFCQQLDDAGGVGRLMVPQLLACSLSFATMLEEARAAESDADFISKCCISLKECRESWTRVRVCRQRKLGPLQEMHQLVQEGNELISIVTAIITNKRKSVAARRVIEQTGKAAIAAAKQRGSRRQRAQAAKPPPRGYEFQIPNS
jgi:four helix bundle protein